MAWLKGILSACFIAANTLAVCLLLFPLALLRVCLAGAWRRRLTWRMDGIIDLWVAGNRWLMRALKLTRLEVAWPEAPLSRQNWYLVVSNHQSWTDILLLQAAFRSAIPPLKFFTKRELLWLPLAGVAMRILGFPYVRRLGQARRSLGPARRDADRASVLAACAGFRNHPTAVLSFLEGTRFSATKLAAQNGRFRHLLNPRIGGLGYVLQGLGEQVEQLIDATLFYPNGIPTFWEFLQGKCPWAQLLLEVHGIDPAWRAADAERQRAALAPFVEFLWRAKDDRLDLAKAGTPPSLLR